MPETSVETSGENKNEKKKGKGKSKKSREWWKDEYFSELSIKRRDVQKGRGKLKKTKRSHNYTGPQLSGEVGNCNCELKRIDEIFTKEWRLADRRACSCSGDLILFGRDCWSSRRPEPQTLTGNALNLQCGDLITRQWSCDLTNSRQGSEDPQNRQWSGELSRSGEASWRDANNTTSTQGTVCYVTPEYGGYRILSEKGNIYNFGVLMLVIIVGRCPIHVAATPMKEFERSNLITWARKLSQSGNVMDLVDNGLNATFDRDEVVMCIALALLCLQ